MTTGRKRSQSNSENPLSNMLTPGHLESSALHEHYAMLATAYLDSAIRLCAVLARSTRKASFERGAVVLHLTLHATELFLKGAISRVAPKEKYSHDTYELWIRYYELYPATKFKFRVELFRPSFPKMTDEQIQAARKSLDRMDQRYRYPTDRNGRPWRGHYGFEPSSCLKDLRMYEADFSRLLIEFDR